MMDMMEEGLREEGSETVEKTNLGNLSASAQRSKAREMAYAKMLMRQLGIEHEEAMELIRKKGTDYFMKMFAPKETDEMESDFSSLKDSLMGIKKAKSQQSELANELSGY